MITRRSLIGICIVCVLLLLIAPFVFFQNAYDAFELLKGKRIIVSLVMEDSHPSREYQKGFDEALMIEEFPVEGLISRFVLLYDRNNLPKEFGPVRSLRPYFVDGVLPWSHAILFAGGSPEAFDRAARSELLAINGLAYAKEFYRTDAPPPHNLFVSGKDITAFTRDTDYAVRWPPYRTSDLASSSGATTIEVNFHSTLSNVSYEYSRIRNAYLRTDGGVKTDAYPQNVLFLEAPITGEGEHGRLTIPLTKGPLLLFRSGSVERGTWEKKGISEPFVFLTEEGKTMHLGKGQTWLTVTPTLDRVSWK